MKDCERRGISQCTEDAVAQEKEWAEFLFREGSMIGLSVPLLGKYVEYICQQETYER